MKKAKGGMVGYVPRQRTVPNVSPVDMSGIDQQLNQTGPRLNRMRRNLLMAEGGKVGKARKVISAVDLDDLVDEANELGGYSSRLYRHAMREFKRRGKASIKSAAEAYRKANSDPQMLPDEYLQPLLDALQE
jgi:hypothetical protein